MPNYGYTPGAYNPYPSYGYTSPYNTPYVNGYTPALPSQQPTPQQPQNVPQQQSNVPWIQVPSIEAARNVMVQPNQTAYIMNQNAPEFYVKAADAMGVATLRSFRFQEFDPTTEAAKQALDSQAGNLVSREEFNKFANNVAARFSALQQNMVVPAPVAQAQPVQQPVQQVQPVQVPAPVAPSVVRGATKKEETAND